MTRTAKVDFQVYLVQPGYAPCKTSWNRVSVKVRSLQWIAEAAKYIVPVERLCIPTSRSLDWLGDIRTELSPIPWQGLGHRPEQAYAEVSHLLELVSATDSGSVGLHPSAPLPEELPQQGISPAITPPPPYSEAAIERTLACMRSNTLEKQFRKNRGKPEATPRLLSMYKLRPREEGSSPDRRGGELQRGSPRSNGEHLEIRRRHSATAVSSGNRPYRHPEVSAKCRPPCRTVRTADGGSQLHSERVDQPGTRRFVRYCPTRIPVQRAHPEPRRRVHNEYEAEARRLFGYAESLHSRYARNAHGAADDSGKPQEKEAPPKDSEPPEASETVAGCKGHDSPQSCGAEDVRWFAIKPTASSAVPADHSHQRSAPSDPPQPDATSPSSRSTMAGSGDSKDLHLPAYAVPSTPSAAAVGVAKNLAPVLVDASRAAHQAITPVHAQCRVGCVKAAYLMEFLEVVNSLRASPWQSELNHTMGCSVAKDFSTLMEYLKAYLVATRRSSEVQLRHCTMDAPKSTYSKQKDAEAVIEHFRNPTSQSAMLYVGDVARR